MLFHYLYLWFILLQTLVIGKSQWVWDFWTNFWAWTRQWKWHLYRYISTGLHDEWIIYYIFSIKCTCCLFETLARETWPHLFKHWIALSSGWITFQWIGIREINCIIRWVEIYPVDSIIHLLNNRGQIIWAHQELANLVLKSLYYYIRNFRNLIGVEQWYFSLIWNTYK